MTFARTRAIAAGYGSFTLTGQDASSRRGYVFSLGYGAFTLTGIAAALRRSRLGKSSAVSVTFSGQSASRTSAYVGKTSAVETAFTGKTSEISKEHKPMARTVRSIIQAAQRKFGALVSGDNTSADEMTDGLEAYNALFAGHSGDWLAPVESARPYRVRHGGSGRPLSRPGLVHHHLARPIRATAHASASRT